MIVTFTFQAETIGDVERGAHEGISAFWGDTEGPRDREAPPLLLPSVLLEGKDAKDAWRRFGVNSLDIVVTEVEGYDFTGGGLRYNVTVRMEIGR